MVVVAGCGDQYTESNERVEEGCAKFVMNSTESEVSSSNVMIGLVETMDLSHSTLRENKENSIEFLGRLRYLLIYKSYLSMCMLSNYQSF